MEETEYLVEIEKLRKKRDDLYTIEIRTSELWNKINTLCPEEFEELERLATKFNDMLKYMSNVETSERSVKLKEAKKLYKELEEKCSSIEWKKAEKEE